MVKKSVPMDTASQLQDEPVRKPVIEVIELDENMDADTSSIANTASGQLEEVEDAKSTDNTGSELEEVSETAWDKIAPEETNIQEAMVPVPEPVTPVNLGEEKQKQLVEEIFTKNDGIKSNMAPENRKSNSILLVWALIVIVAAITTGLGLLFFSGKSNNQTQKAPSVVPTQEITTTPAPSAIPTVPSIAKEDINIEVLNGGGVAGAASKMKDFLVRLGYKVGDTGNASDYSYEKTEIHVKSGQENIADMLSSDLEDDYTLGSSSADLDADSEYDVRIIVGSE